MNKKLIWGIVIVVVLAVIAVGTSYWNEKTAELRTAARFDDVTSTSDWKTYTNSQFGFSVSYPPTFTLNERDKNSGYLVALQDQSKVFPNPDMHNSINISAKSANGITSFSDYVKKYPIVSGNTNKPFQFNSRVIGSNTFYYALTEHFEGTLAFDYYILRNDTLYGFSSVSQGVDWTNPNLDEENDSTHLALRQILSTFKFTSSAKCSEGQVMYDGKCESASYRGTNPNMSGGLNLQRDGDLGFAIKVLSPKTGDIFKIGEKVSIMWDDRNDAANYTITLVNRNTSTVDLIIANEVFSRSSGIDGTNSYEWTIPAGVDTRATYNIEVYQATARELTGRSQLFTITN